MKILKFRLEGLHCPACVKLSTLRLKSIDNIENINIDLESGVTEISSNREIDYSEVEQVFRGTDYSISQI